MKSRLLTALLAGCLAFTARADVENQWVDDVVAAYRHARPVELPGPIGPAAAVRVQSRVVEALKDELGDVFGYKAGLTSPAAQKRFNVDEPILGTLLTGMILDNGARVPVSKGVHLLIEADLLVRVADRRINQAVTRQEALAAIDFVAPFVEIPDVITQPGQPVDGPALTAVNSGARFGVIGTPVPAESLDVGDLAAFTVRLMRDGEPAGPESSGRALMGHPLNVVLWMVEKTRSRGLELEAGDWLSLGSLTPPVEPRAGEAYNVVYEGLGPRRLDVFTGFTR